MRSKIFTPGFIFIVSVIIMGSLFRLLPHLPNFTPVAAIAIFSGTYLRKKIYAFIIPILCLLLSDMVLGFHNYMPAVYFSFGISVLLGFIVRRNIKLLSVLTASLSSSVIFFIITNLAVWYASPYYSHDFSGLARCYILGLPFFNNGIVGDLFFNSIFFGINYYATRRFAVLAKI
jgi:hypothetical protein